MSKTVPISKKGKPRARKDPRNLNIASYLSLKEIGIPLAHDWTRTLKTAWGALGNNTLENCTCAAAGHMIKCWTANANSEFEITEEAIIHTYITLSNYDPVTGANNEGVYMLDALKYWRKTGIDKHRIRIFAALPEDQRETVKAAIYLFGGIYVGLLLPLSCRDQEIWAVKPGGLTGDNEPESYGGHAVAILAYDEEHLTCVTLGKEKKMTWEFWEAYNDEAYAIITDDFLRGGKTPLGLDMDTMEQDLKNLADKD